MSFEEILDVLAYDDQKPILRALFCKIVCNFRLFMYKSYILDVIWGNIGRIGIWWPKTHFTHYAKLSAIFGCSCTNHTFLMSFEEIWDVLAYDVRKPILRAVQNSLQFSAVRLQIIHFGCYLRKYGTYWHMITENPFYALCNIVSSFRLFMYKSYILDVISGNMGRTYRVI